MPLGRLSTSDTPLGSRRLVVSPPVSTGWIHPCSSHKRIEQGCRHCMRALWLRTTLRKQLLGHPRAMPGVWGRFALHRILPRKEFMGRALNDRHFSNTFRLRFRLVSRVLADSDGKSGAPIQRWSINMVHPESFMPPLVTCRRPRIVFVFWLDSVLVRRKFQCTND